MNEAGPQTSTGAASGGAGEAGRPVARRGVLCIKCEHLNPPDIEACEDCGAHLFVNCQECQTKNPRVSARCSHCGRRLHKRKKRHGREERGVNLVFIGLVLGAILAAIIAVFVVAGIRLPRLW